MPKKTTVERSALEPWQVEDAARLKEIFARKKDEARVKKEPFTQELFAADNGFTSAAMVWQLLNAHRPLNIKAAAAFARGLGVKVEEFSPTLAEQIDQVADVQEPRIRVVSEPESEPQLQWIKGKESELLSEFRACGPAQMERALGFLRSLPKAVQRPSAEAGGAEGKA